MTRGSWAVPPAAARAGDGASRARFGQRPARAPGRVPPIGAGAAGSKRPATRHPSSGPPERQHGQRRAAGGTRAGRVEEPDIGGQRAADPVGPSSATARGPPRPEGREVERGRRRRPARRGRRGGPRGRPPSSVAIGRCGRSPRICALMPARIAFGPTLRKTRAPSSCIRSISETNSTGRPAARPACRRTSRLGVRRGGGVRVDREGRTCPRRHVGQEGPEPRSPAPTRLEWKAAPTGSGSVTSGPAVAAAAARGEPGAGARKDRLLGRVVVGEEHAVDAGDQRLDSRRAAPAPRPSRRGRRLGPASTMKRPRAAESAQQVGLRHRSPAARSATNSP